MDKAEAPLAPPEAVAAEALRESEVAAEGADGTPESPAAVAEHKRKREELEAEEPPHEEAKGESVAVDTTAVEAEAEPAERENGVAGDEQEDQIVTAEAADGTTTGDGKRQRLDEETAVAGIVDFLHSAIFFLSLLVPRVFDFTFLSRQSFR